MRTRSAARVALSFRSTLNATGLGPPAGGGARPPRLPLPSLHARRCRSAAVTSATLRRPRPASAWSPQAVGGKLQCVPKRVRESQRRSRSPAAALPPCNPYSLLAAWPPPAGRDAAPLKKAASHCKWVRLRAAQRPTHGAHRPGKLPGAAQAGVTQQCAWRAACRPG